MSSSTTQFYRDSKGNILNSSGKVMMSASTVKTMGSEYVKKIATFPLYGASEKDSSKKDSSTATDKKKTTISDKGTPYFMGESGLVQYNGIPWVVDSKTKTLRPYDSLATFNRLHDYDVEELPELGAGALEEDGTLGDYTVLKPEYAIKSDGTMKRYDASDIQARYGKSIDTAMEKTAYGVVDGFVDLLSSENSGISSEVLSSLTNDSARIAKYINALAYGGYTLSDIYADIAKDDLIASGQNQYSKVDPISTSKTRDAYQMTNEAKKAYGDPLLALPTALAGINESTWNLPIWSIPSEAFKTLIPLFDYNSDEMQTAMDEIESAYHDIVLQQLQAQTEQEKAIADYNYQRFKEEVEKKYNVTLSNSAIGAWEQINGLQDEMSGRGLTGSGIEAESIDDYLKKVRETDKLTRDSKMTQKESEEASYFLKYATPEEVKKLIETDPEKAKKWGLVPSDDVKNALSFETLRAKYPKEVTDEELSDYISTILDENGNYRSELYQRYSNSALKNKQDKQTYQQEQVYNNYLTDEETAYANYTTPDSPFLRYDETKEDEFDNLDIPDVEKVISKTDPEKLNADLYNKPKTPATPVVAKKWILNTPTGPREVSEEMAKSYTTGANSLAPGYSITPPSSNVQTPAKINLKIPTTTKTPTTSTYSKTIAQDKYDGMSSGAKEAAKKLGYTVIPTTSLSSNKTSSSKTSSSNTSSNTNKNTTSSSSKTTTSSKKTFIDATSKRK